MESTENKYLEALKNAVRSANLEGLNVEIHIPNDKRVKQDLFLLSFRSTSISPVLNYDKMNHFILGFSRALRITKELN